MTGRPAAFLDRDGTVIRDASYVRDPLDVELLDGAAAAIRTLNDRSIPVVLVTNQSGVGRGLLTLADYHAVQRKLNALLAVEGARIDATYMCPHNPDKGDACDCRKPGLALFRRAIADHNLDASRSLFVGDRWRDVAPATAFGGRGILLDVVSTPESDRDRARAESIVTAASLREAVDQFLAMLPASGVGQ